MRTIEELRKEQKESVNNSSQFNHLREQTINETNIEEVKIELFANKFAFQLEIKRSNDVSWIFNLFTFVTDFYMYPEEINLLKKLINHHLDNISRQPINANLIFDEKMVLIGLLLKYFCDNIKQFPNNFIRVSKQDLLKIKGIGFKYNISGINLTNSSYDLSKLEYLIMDSENNLDEIKIEGLSSLKALKLAVFSVERISLKNLNELKDLVFDFISKTSFRLRNEAFDNLKNTIDKFSFIDVNFKVDFSKSAKSLNICLTDENSTNDLAVIYQIYHDINKLTINSANNDNIRNLLSGQNFPQLEELQISYCNVTKIERQMLNGQFPMLKKLSICHNMYLQIIYHDAFLNLTELKDLEICYNYIGSLNERTFSELVNLESIKLLEIRLKTIDILLNPTGLKNLESIETYPNQLANISTAFEE